MKRGYLWLGADDWLECPQCGTTGRVPVIEQHHEPTGRTFIHGSTQGFAVNPVWSRRF